MNDIQSKDFLYEHLGKCHSKLARNRVWCKSCGRTIQVDSSECLRNGWPTCCDETMTIDAPGER